MDAGHIPDDKSYSYTHPILSRAPMTSRLSSPEMARQYGSQLAPSPPTLTTSFIKTRPNIVNPFSSS
jgi:hypothetical protein